MDSIILGTITIDEHNNIIDFNEAARTAMPGLAKMQKCFEAFLDKHESCAFCPVLKKDVCSDAGNGVDSESVIEVPLANGERLHIVSFIVDKNDNKPALSCMKYNLDDYSTSSRLLKLASEEDKPTGLYTMQAFVKHAEKLLRDNPEEHYNLIISGIRNFQLITATYGEESAQELFRSLAVFTAKIYEDGIVPRYGVDQIVRLCKAPSQKRQIEIAARFKEFLAATSIHNIIVDYGVYEDVDRSLSIMNMCLKARTAFNTIIKDYRRNFAQYNDSVTQIQLRDQRFEARFDDALQNEEFKVWYQPKYEPYTERIVGAEALVRWQTREGMVSPGEFLPVFEADGLIASLDLYVFRCVCRQQREWLDAGRALFPISVNVSRSSLFENDIVRKYKEIVDFFGIEPKYVPIEITESVALENLKIKPIADAFIKEGFLLHMDDFGSGRSSLNGLNVLDFEAVKLDKSLIDFIGQKSGELILNHTMALAKELGVLLVAEGVETASQLQFLKAKGCDMIQGFYFSKPLPLLAFEEKLAEKGYDSLEEYLQGRGAVKAPNVNIDHLYTHMPGGFFSYEAFGEEKILSSNSYLWQMFGFDNEDDFMAHVRGSFRGLVCPEELERVEASIERQVKSSALEMDFVKYHIIHRDGHRIPVVDYGHLSHPKNKNIFYVFIYEEGKQHEGL